MNKISKTQNIPAKFFYVAGLLLLVKLLLLPFVQATDPDAVNRVFITLHWMKYPNWIMTSNWGPFHYYLNAFFLSIWDNKVYTPAILNVFLSVLTLFPFFLFVKREFNEKGAIMATIFLAISPVIFRNSFLALSETPYLFFLILSLNLLSKGIKEKKERLIIFAGLLITTASGFRYEAWLLSLAFVSVLMLRYKPKIAIAYASVAFLFPIIWILQSRFETGQSLYNFQWAVNANNDIDSVQSLLRRITFFPFSWLIAVGPPLAYITLKEIFSLYKTVSGNKNSLWVWTIPFWTIFLFIFCNGLKGTLLLQHRFAETLTILSLPFSALYFNEFTRRKIRIALICGSLTIGLSFVWNTAGVRMLPRLKDPQVASIASLIRAQINNESGVILDFWNWENTYYISLESLSDGDNAVIFNSDKISDITKEAIAEILRYHSKGLILMKKGSPLSHEINLNGNQLSFNWIKTSLTIKNIYENSEVTVFLYSE